LPSAALGKGLSRRVPDEMLSAKIFALGKGAVSGSEYSTYGWTVFGLPSSPGGI
jgi:hypothetical protein